MRILLLDLDTLRPDHLGCYGYHRNTSPNIDRIAEDGVRFDNYYCSDAPCLPSRMALVTGMLGIHNGVVGHGGTAADLRIEGATRSFRSRLGRESLWNVFRNAGLRTVSISPFAERHSAWGFLAGFNETYNPGKCGSESAEEVTPTVLDWLDRNGKDDNWLLHVNYWDPHTPYRAPAEFGNPFADDPIPEWITPETLENHRRMVGPHKAREISMYDNRVNPDFPRQPGEIRDMNDLRTLFDGYDCGIRYMDDHIGSLFKKLSDLGVMDDLILIITSDHGENLGELGIYSEHGTADEITCRIPMIIRWPGKTSGHVDRGFHYNIDLMPTLAEMLKVDASELWDGCSYAPVIENGADSGRDSLVLSQCAHVCQRSMRWGPWLYTRTYHDGYHLFPREMLFNVANDPHEESDLADTNPDIVREGAGMLFDWHDSMMQSMPGKADPLQTVLDEGGPLHARGNLKRYVEYLRKTDREYAIDELKKRHPREFE